MLVLMWYPDLGRGSCGTLIWVGGSDWNEYGTLIWVGGCCWVHAGCLGVRAEKKKKVVTLIRAIED